MCFEGRKNTDELVPFVVKRRASRKSVTSELSGQRNGACREMPARLARHARRRSCGKLRSFRLRFSSLGLGSAGSRFFSLCEKSSRGEKTLCARTDLPSRRWQRKRLTVLGGSSRWSPSGSSWWPDLRAPRFCLAPLDGLSRIREGLRRC